MRRKIKTKREISADPVYNSPRVTKFMNYIMQSGNKNEARKVVYRMLDLVKEKGKTENPLAVFETALNNTAPNVEVRSRRVGGANYQVPVEVRPARRQALSMRWLIDAARNKKGTKIHIRLADEVLAAAKNEGEAIKKRENTHKMAEANKAFAHFAW